MTDTAPPPSDKKPASTPKRAGRPVVQKLLIGTGVFLMLGATFAWVVYGGGEHEGPGEVTKAAWPSADVAARQKRQQQALEALPGVANAGQPAKQILFGDLHVHSTFSADAFAISLPFVSGEGAHPPADACDYARFCSALDFFAMTDHAESLTPQHWEETKESLRQCNAVAGDTKNPDLVPFLGYEWTQVGPTPDTHYGHKNVIFRHLDEDKVPKRPIAAGGLAAAAMRGRGGLSLWTLASIPIRDFPNRKRYLDLAMFQEEVSSVDDCPEGVDPKELPADCRERAVTPQDLFGKLDQLGHDAMVIPHGTTWGFYTPHGYSWDKQLAKAMRDPKRQFLFEVFSGHGNSEEYRAFRGMTGSSDMEKGACPEPTAEYEPCCWRAGELVRSKCRNISQEACDKRVAEAKANYLAAGASGHWTVPGATATDWGDCGQCRDCFNPSFNYRPGGSAQYVLAKANFDDKKAPYTERFGFIASSDNHTARPGTGYKEVARRKFTEASGARDADWAALILGEARPLASMSRKLDMSKVYQMPPFQALDLERQSSFFLTGGLVAVHSQGRDRDAIYDALERKEVYGTSGDRILLWFDLENGPDGRAPMGSVAALNEAPRFTVRAVGALEQQDGCPEHVKKQLGEERLQHVCAGQCYNPGNTRRTISRIEIVRIRPQTTPDQDVAKLIEDPWKTLKCVGEATCQATFTDPDFVGAGREFIYYARAIQAPTPAVNAEGMRCTGEGADRTCKPCYGDYRTGYDDDCLSPNEERAWSSPIFVRP